MPDLGTSVTPSGDPVELLRDEPTPVEVISSETVFAGKVWNIQRDTFTIDGAPIVRDFMDHTGAVAVLAMDENDRVLLIQQYRHPIASREWELPAGLLDIEEEPPLLAAQRELAEEVDLVAERWDLLADFSSSAGGSNEVIRVFLARGVSAAATVFERTEEEAGIVTRWVSLDDAVDAVLDRRVHNAILTIAVLSAHAMRARGWTQLGDPQSDWPEHPRERASR